MDLLYAYQEWAYTETFRISRSASANSALFVVYVRDGALIGRGECGLLPQYGQTKEHVVAALEHARKVLSAGVSRQDLPLHVENTSARNALDCALWDLECKKSEQDIWRRTGVARTESIEVDLTIGINPLEKMRSDAVAAVAAGYRILKLKADRNDVLDNVAAIAGSCPGIRLIVDANEAWDIATLNRVSPELKRLGVCLIEQPLHHQSDAALRAYEGPVPLCADESCSS
ncbi:MAG: dipeptide epimerase, partial [Alphaproteobacteria bacterium]|nr:dipeptide epimerase [Alphaproteobacteria bacterium]